MTNKTNLEEKNKPLCITGFRIFRGASGFTLLEMLVAIFIVVILATLAAPSLTDLVNQMRLRTVAEQFFQSLTLARSEAIKRNVRTVVCRSATGDTCDVAGNWQLGWIVFKDANGNAQVDEGDEVIYRQAALPDNLRFSGNTNVAHYVSYSPNGVSKMVGGGLQMGTFVICSASVTATAARKVVISKPGFVHVEKSLVDTCP